MDKKKKDSSYSEPCYFKGKSKILVEVEKSYGFVRWNKRMSAKFA